MAEETRWWLWEPPAGGSIGKTGLRRKDVSEKATGKAIYTRDINRPGQLYAKQLLSPHAHAKMKSIDYSKAENLPGVRTIIKWDDPDVKDIEIFRFFPREVRWTEFIENEAHWYPAPVGPIVVCDTEQICDEALRLIDIQWEELPFILNPEDALKPGATILRPDLNSENNIEIEIVTDIGSVDEGFAASKHILEFTVRCDLEDTWAGVEGQCAVVEIRGDYLDVWAHSQHPCEVTDDIRKQVPGFTRDKINCHVPYQGATFGGQTFLGQGSITAIQAAIAAKRTGRPVKMIYDKSHFAGCEEQYGYYHFKVGYNDDGKINAVDFTTYYTAQTAHDQLVKITEATGIPNYHVHDIQPYLNKNQPVCWKHGPPACMIQHQVFGHVAAALGMDPQQLARVNDGIAPGEYMDHADHIKTEQGFSTANSLEDVIQAGNPIADWNNKKHEPGSKILPNGKYHGMGWTWNIHWSHVPGGGTNPGIIVQPDGGVRILARRSDMGVDAESTYCRVVADEVGARYDDVNCRPFDEIPGFEHIGGGGSTGTANNLPSLILSARKAKQGLLEYAVKPGPRGAAAVFAGKTVDDLDIKDGYIFEKSNTSNKKPISAVTAVFWQGSGPQAPKNHPFFYQERSVTPSVEQHVFARQAYWQEVEVDPDTGQIDVKKMVVVNDLGRAISPDGCKGQQIGGTYMGFGKAIEAQYYCPTTGVKLNDNLLGYTIPTILEIEEIDPVILENKFGYGAYGLYGIGESAAANGAVILNVAVYNAIGKWIDFPCTPDKILKALGKG